ncbi:MAG: hypothetical protein AAGB34_03175 [Planctomycetota bacterium]
MLKDIVSSLDLNFFAISSLLIFFVVFVVVSIRSISRNGHVHERMASTPLVDDAPLSPDAAKKTR